MEEHLTGRCTHSLVLGAPSHRSIQITARGTNVVQYVHQVYLRRTCLSTKGRSSPDSDALSFRLIRDTPTPKINKCRRSLRPALLLYDHQTSPLSPNGPRPLVALPMLYREGCQKSASAKTIECIHPPRTHPPVDRCRAKSRSHLTTETVQGTALALEGVDYVKGGDGLALGVLSVGDGVTDDTLEEGLEDRAGLLVDHCRDG